MPLGAWDHAAISKSIRKAARQPEQHALDLCLFPEMAPGYRSTRDHSVSTHLCAAVCQCPTSEPHLTSSVSRRAFSSSSHLSPSPSITQLRMASWTSGFGCWRSEQTAPILSLSASRAASLHVKRAMVWWRTAEPTWRETRIHFQHSASSEVHLWAWSEQDRSLLPMPQLHRRVQP